jgi:hypothetical protein
LSDSRANINVLHLLLQRKQSDVIGRNTEEETERMGEESAPSGKLYFSN